MDSSGRDGGRRGEEVWNQKRGVMRGGEYEQRVVRRLIIRCEDKEGGEEGVTKVRAKDRCKKVC